MQEEFKNDTLLTKLERMVDQHPNEMLMQIKIDDHYQQYTYQDFFEMTQKIAHFLIDSNFQPGDRAAILLKNRPEWGAVYFGILYAKGAAVPIDPQSKSEDIEYFLEHSECKTIFLSEERFNELEAILKKSPHLKNIVLLDAQDEQAFDKQVVLFSSILKKELVSRIQATCQPDDLASILYTSGTTGRPKGVMLTHRNFCSNYEGVCQLNAMTESMHFLSILPLHHAFPFMSTLLTPIFYNCRITYLSELSSSALMQCIKEAGITVLVGVPQLFYMIHKQIVEAFKQYPFFVRWPLNGVLSVANVLRSTTSINFPKFILGKLHARFGKQLKYFLSGGAKFDVEVKRFLIKLGFTIYEGYGLTETAPVVSFNFNTPKTILSAGKPISNVKVKIDQPNEQGVGEILIQGPNVMQGYFKMPSETADVLKDNWFYSGDLGYLNQDGYLYITGRKKEVIVLSSGKNIAPEEVETHYLKGAHIKELCVLAVKADGQEKLMAAIVPDLGYFKKSGEIDIHGLVKWDLETLSVNLPDYKRIRGFIIVKDDLPRTRLGKLKRYEVEANYLDELKDAQLGKVHRDETINEEDAALIQTELYQNIIEIIRQQVKIKGEINPNDHLEIELGLDSLSRVELIATLEKTYDIKLPQALIANVFTVKDLVQQIDLLLQDRADRQEVKTPVVGQEELWKEIIQEKPSEELLKNIDLNPSKRARFVIFLFCSFLRLLFKLFFRLKVKGLENLPQDKAFIFCPNHVSYLDGFIVNSVLPNKMVMRVFSIGFKAYFDAPIVRNLTKIGRLVVIDRAGQLTQALQVSAYILKQGKIATLFPEGARSIDGKVKEFRKGVGILAKELNVPLVPVYLDGVYEAWPRTRKFPRLHPMSITFGKPYGAKTLLKEGKALGVEDDYEAIVVALRKKVIALKKESV